MQLIVQPYSALSGEEHYVHAVHLPYPVSRALHVAHVDDKI